MSKGHDFYDKDQAFRIYQEHRQRQENPNNTLERPVIYELLGDTKGKSFLDLGCGDGIFGVELLSQGAAAYTGIEGSEKMLELAKQNLASTTGVLVRQSLEDWQPLSESVDVVTSRLALHYIEDLESIFFKVARALKPEGRFIVSVEHPVITSHYESLAKGKRTSWLVDNYFLEGPREHRWLAESVVKYHRTLETYLRLLQETGFSLEALREAEPKEENFQSESEFERRQRIPLFLCFAAKKRLRRPTKD